MQVYSNATISHHRRYVLPLWITCTPHLSASSYTDDWFLPHQNAHCQVLRITIEAPRKAAAQAPCRAARTGARDGALMVWDARAQQLVCQRSGTAYQAPVLAVQART